MSGSTGAIHAGELKIRNAEYTDALPVASLLGELGYPATPEKAGEKITSLSGYHDAILVAEFDGKVVGLTSIHLVPMIHDQGFLGKITSLVVSRNFRGNGFGKMLLTAAETFSLSKGATRMEVISGNHRPEAHAFYRSLGYSATNQTRFIRVLASP